MNIPIDISTAAVSIPLEVGKAQVYLLGGWDVKLNDFSFALRGSQSDILLYPTEAFLKIQTYAFGKRAKRIFVIEVPAKDVYKIVFYNVRSLVVKNSNVSLMDMLRTQQRVHNLAIFFTKKYSFFGALG